MENGAKNLVVHPLSNRCRNVISQINDRDQSTTQAALLIAASFRT
jgi:hypothetical protein